ncbi:MAG: DUF2249 domain-containing protein [Clostridia bacterium]|nr:DUF2249 domain-containing protein [Clostridia bacterium]
MTSEPLTLDVRDDLRQGREPLPKIMAAVKQLQPGQSLRLLTTFEPIPLFHVMAHKGFRHEARRLGEGDWEVLFIPSGAEGAEPGAAAPAGTPADGAAKPGASGGTAAEDEPWPAPARTLDNRGLMPPEPMVRVLEALESLKDGEVLEVFNDREPMFLLPELEQRGYAVRMEKLDSGVRLHIRRKKVTPR